MVTFYAFNGDAAIGINPTPISGIITFLTGFVFKKKKNGINI